jgi:hypothetical protein
VGSVGPHFANASCIGNAAGGFQLVVSLPLINSSVGRPTPGISTIGSQHNQLVAYKTTIWYSADAANWQPDASAGWRAGWVADSFNSPVGASIWYDYDAGKWVGTVQSWNLNRPGYYRAALQYYWFADSASDAGSDYVWAEHFDYSFSFQGVAYCSVP